MSQRKKPAIRITAFNTSDIVLGTVDGFPPWPGEIVDPAMAPDTIKQKKKKNRFANKSTELVRFFPGGEYAWLSPTRVTQLSVTQIEEFVANSGHKKPQLVNGYRKAAERAKDHRQIAPENLHKCGGGEEEKEEEEVFPTDNKEKRKHHARAVEEKFQPLPGGYRPSAISANLGVVPLGFASSRLGPGGPIICSDIAMTFELSVNARLFGPTTIRGDAESLLAFFQSHGGARHFEYICYAHAMLGVVEEGLGHRTGNVTPKIEGSTPLGMVFQHVDEEGLASLCCSTDTTTQLPRMIGGITGNGPFISIHDGSQGTTCWMGFPPARTASIFCV
ncbi:hypothetical protein B0H14DRAFT_3137550 [Mycena olivaceomarginata]|nr:hypothetical protein B0H14DRAFT_3137550 [Mycena olivaceomarginata]